MKKNPETKEAKTFQSNASNGRPVLMTTNVHI